MEERDKWKDNTRRKIEEGAEESFFTSSLPLAALQALRAARWDLNS